MLWFTFEGNYTAVLFVTLILFLALRARKTSGNTKPNLKYIDQMSGEQFEVHVADLFNRKGYKAAVTGGSHDYGADVIAKKKGEVIVVQCKRYKKPVGIGAIQEVLGAKSYYQGTQAMVVTNSYYTQAAKNLADSANVMLIDRDSLSTL